MKLTLLPLEADELIRIRCEGPLSRREPDDPLHRLLGPHCYSHKVLLNLEGCQMADTSGISWLLSSDRQFRKSGGRLVLYSVPPIVIDVLHFVRLEALLHLASTEQVATEQALESGEHNGTATEAERALRFSPVHPI